MDHSGRAYEDFVPPHHMVREPPTHTLSVDLSAAGYKKEHIMVQLVHSHRRLVVRGERPVAGNRWSRFRLEFKLPDDCDTKGVQARFEKGVVYVTMPGQKQEPVSADALVGQQKPASASPAANNPADAPAASGGAERQDGDLDRAAAAPPAGGAEDVQKDQETTQVQKEGVPQHRVVSSAKDARRDDGASEGGDATPTAASPSRSQGYGQFLRGRKKTATTVLGVVLVLVSLGIYVRYSIAP